MPQDRNVFIVDALRTPVGRYGGGLASVRPDDLLAHTLRALLARQPKFDPALLEDVVMGAANQAGEDNRNVARMAALLAGLPPSVPGTTVNRLCASGLQAVVDASRAIKAGEGRAYLAGGVESMTRAPFVMAKSDAAWGRTPEVFDTTIGWRFTNPALAALYHPFTMGETAENVAEKYAISRADQDTFALESQRRWAAAQAAGKFADELVGVPVPSKKGDSILFAVDEHPRPETTLEQLAKLKPAFRSGGSVTAGNSSGINDGAAALLLVEEELMRTLGLVPLARIVGSAAAGVDPAVMGIGPVPAIQRLVQRTGIPLGLVDRVELNEAFAAQSLACIRLLDLDPACVNVNGGAIAIGHPLGASGARLLTTLAYELRRTGGRYGIATLCVGVGQGLALMIESV
jgi:3-oxoadipyl-CoA thiolase